MKKNLRKIRNVKWSDYGERLNTFYKYKKMI